MFNSMTNALKIVICTAFLLIAGCARYDGAAAIETMDATGTAVQRELHVNETPAARRAVIAESIAKAIDARRGNRSPQITFTITLNPRTDIPTDKHDLSISSSMQAEFSGHLEFQPEGIKLVSSDGEEEASVSDAEELVDALAEKFEQRLKAMQTALEAQTTQ